MPSKKTFLCFRKIFKFKNNSWKKVLKLVSVFLLGYEISKMNKVDNTIASLFLCACLFSHNKILTQKKEERRYSRSFAGLCWYLLDTESKQNQKFPKVHTPHNKKLSLKNSTYIFVCVFLSTEKKNLIELYYALLYKPRNNNTTKKL